MSAIETLGGRDAARALLQPVADGTGDQSAFARTLFKQDQAIAQLALQALDVQASVVPAHIHAKASELMQWSSRPVGFSDRARELSAWILSIGQDSAPQDEVAKLRADLMVCRTSYEAVRSVLREIRDRHHLTGDMGMDVAAFVHGVVHQRDEALAALDAAEPVRSEEIEAWLKRNKSLNNSIDEPKRTVRFYQPDESFAGTEGTRHVLFASEIDEAVALMRRARPAAVPVVPADVLGILREANIKRLARFKNAKGAPAHSHANGSDWKLSAWSNAVCGELGEAANIIKKIERGDFTLDEARPALAHEFADVLCYLDILAFRADVNLWEATVGKWNEISERIGYPERLSLAQPTAQPASVQDVQCVSLPAEIASIKQDRDAARAELAKVRRELETSFLSLRRAELNTQAQPGDAKLREMATDCVRVRCDTNSGAGVKRGWVEVREENWNALQDARLALGKLLASPAPSEAPPPSARYPDEKHAPSIEVRREMNGELDEIVAHHGYIHLERMDDDKWWFCIEAGGKRIDVNFQASEIIAEEDGGPTTKAKAPPPSAGIERAVAELRCIDTELQLLHNEVGSGSLPQASTRALHVIGERVHRRIAVLRAEQPPAEPAVQPVLTQEIIDAVAERSEPVAAELRKVFGAAVPPIPLDEARLREQLEAAKVANELKTALRWLNLPPDMQDSAEDVRVKVDRLIRTVKELARRELARETGGE